MAELRVRVDATKRRSQLVPTGVETPKTDQPVGTVGAECAGRPGGSGVVAGAIGCVGELRRRLGVVDQRRAGRRGARRPLELPC
jgi:hypothetical protein